MRARPITRRGPMRAALLAVLCATLAACSSSTEPGSDPSDRDDDDVAGGDLASELRGRWLHGSLSALSQYNATTGQWLGNASGMGVMFEFTAGGRYTQSIVVEQRNYGCQTLIQIYNEGTAVSTGSTFRVYPTRGRIRSSDTCNAQFNYDRADDLAKKQGDRYSWTRDTDPGTGKPRLLIGIGDDDPAPSDFHPVQ